MAPFHLEYPTSMHISDFDYDLPPELIAKEPARPRDASRMMVVDRRTGQWTDSVFRRLPDFLRSSDVLVLNDTRVIRARLYGKLERAAGTARVIEVLFAAPAGDATWEVMCRPGKRIRPGDRVIFGEGEAEVEGVFGESREYGLRLLRLNSSQPVEELFERHGHIPLPPYIEREDTRADAAEYQTIYASESGAVAAPTAGLHFSESMMETLTRQGVEILKITLHVGIGTFLPVRSEDPHEHMLKPERFEITEEAAARLNAARDAGRRIIAVGTTTTRTLEYAIRNDGVFEASKSEADLYILPGYEFRAVDAMLTNFHLPRSTLFMLVSAFVSRPRILEAYRHAVEERYRFYSYGDCMFIV
jgi:S-adenosylmethionine:tRNA ribosyltransferase-isomerase